MEKRCECCKRRFIPRPTVRHQEYCSNPECQKARKRNWQKEKLASDSDYRANQAEAQRQWRSRNWDYWRQYRRRNPAYTEGNRMGQRERNPACGGTIGVRDCKDGRADRGTECYFKRLLYGGTRVVIAKRGLARIWMKVVISFLRMKEQLCIEEIAVSEIGERYGVFRIMSPRADAAMVKSIQKYGQISPVVCVRAEGGYQMIDGFKRLRAFRRLNQTTLRAKTMEVSGRVCKVAILQLNGSGRLINEMEEALVVQSLHREDGLTQIEIGVLLGRDKSWVSRRISLIERLSEEVQEDLRLGLIPVMMGRELAKLPRGNQKDVVDAILKRRYSTREAAKLIGYLLSRPRWESSAILASSWEVVEQRQPRPRGLGAKLLSLHEICQAVSKEFSQCSPETRRGLSLLIERTIGSAEEVLKTLRTAP